MRHAHRFFLSTAAALVLLAAAGTAAAQTLVRRPYLQTLTPTSVTIVWTTDVATNSRVRYGASPQSLVNVVTLPAAVTQHEVRLANLSPGTRYYYSVGTSAAVLAGGDQTHYFGTAPLPGTATRFRAWLMSDAGTTDPALLGNRDAMLAYVGADRPSLFLTAGDMVHDQGDDQEYTTNFFGVFHSVLRNTVTWPAYGNHEGWYGDSRTQTGAFYRAYVLPTSGEAGGVASGTEAYYSFDHANVHFVVLNSYDIPREPGSAMLDWLESDLASTRQEWLIAYWHYSPYSKGSHDSDTDYAQIEMREYVVPILEGAGVDLVFSGHSHDYERSHLVDGAYDTPTTAAGHVVDDGDGQPLGGGAYLKPAGLSPHAGTVYMVVGHAVWPGPVGLHPLMHVAQSDVGSCLLEVEGNRLSVVNLRSDGVVSDSFTILKGTGGSGGTGGAGGTGGTGGTGDGGTGDGGGGSDGSGNGGGGSGGTGGSGGSGGGIDPCLVEVPVCVTIRRGTLGAVEDATIWQSAPGWNDGASGTLYTGTSSSGFRVSLVWFDLASIPEGSPVCSSTLRLLQSWKTTTSTVRVHEALLPWDESSVTWGSFNQAWDPAVLGSLIASGAGGERLVDVTAAVEGWVEDGIPNDGFVLEEDPVDRSPFYSSESGTLSRRPALEVCYVP